MMRPQYALANTYVKEAYSSMFNAKTMSKKDIRFAISLTDTAEWELDEEDFEFTMRLEPEGCFVLLHDSVRIGIATTVNYGHVGWFGNLIVSKENRKQGAGTTLVTHAIKYLTDKGVRTVGLYAYMDKIPFYEKIGFKHDSDFTVLKGKGFSSRGNSDVRQAETVDIRQIVAFDNACLGFSREKLLKTILLKPSNFCYLWVEDEKLLGYGIAKVYNGAAEVGPLVCHQGFGNISIELLNAIMNRLKGSEIVMCVPERQRPLIESLMKRDFRVDFHVAKMFRGESITEDCICAAESLERG